MVESFWAIPDATQLRTPLTILREQASELTAQTGGVLVGITDAHTYTPRSDNRLMPSSDQLMLSLIVSVPALNDYRLRILEYTQPIKLYPGRLRSIHGNEEGTVNDEETFIQAVKLILSSDSVRNILTSLMSQAKDP